MKPRLYVLQHGNALSKNEDAERPLSGDGRHDIEQVAGYLSKNSVQIQHIFHSGKLRAQQTAEIISEKVTTEVTPEKISSINPNDDPAQFIESIAGEENGVLIASHMPFVSNLCSVLLTGASGAQFGFTPGSVACLGYEDGCWTLLWLVSPEVF